tara:strand:- start:683 stop:2104 length:1422 start_codon:yes stop_codon:yes gene_type:complete
MQKLWDRFFKEKKGSLTGLTRYQKWLLFKAYYTTGPGAKEKALWEGTFLDYEKWKGSGKEISAWWNENVKDDSDSDEDIEITDEEIEAIATESTRDFEFEAQTPRMVGGRPIVEDSKLYQDLDTYGIDTEYYDRFVQLWGFNPSEEKILEWQATLPEDEQEVGAAQALAYLNLMSGENILRPAYTDEGVPVIIRGKHAMMPFSGHWGGVKIEDILDSNASFDEIRRFQDYLTSNNIVPDNYFAESYGESSAKLRQSIKYVMNWLDENKYVVKGTETYDAIQAEFGENPTFFSESQRLYDDFNYHRNLFNYALEEMAKDISVIDEIEEAELAKQIAEDYIPPTENTLKDMVDVYFEAKLGRKATDEELDMWSTKFAQSYSTAAAIAASQAQKKLDYNFMVSQPEYLELEEDRKALQKEYPGIKVIDLSAFSTPTPQELMEGQLEEEYGKQIDAVEQGRQVRKMQNDLITYMFGR